MAEINKIQFKRGSTLSNAGTPAAGEPIYDTSTGKLYIGDGSTAAGGATPSLVAISDDKLPLTGGTLTGSLGIGVTSPETPLAFEPSNTTTATEGIKFQNSSSASDAILQPWKFASGMGLVLGSNFYIDTTGNVNKFNSSEESSGILIDPRGTLNFYTGGATGNATSALTIDSSQRVGIGVSPNAPLQFSNDADTRKIVLYEGANNDYQFYGFGIEGSTLVYSTYTTSDDHVFFAGTGASSRNELMRIGGDGNIGINQGNPSGKLEIKGTSDNQLFLDSNSASANTGIFFKEAGTNKWEVYHRGASNDFRIYNYANNTPDFIIASGGAITFNNAYTFPTSIGTAGQVLKVPASPGTTLEWGDAGGGNSITGDLTVTDYESRITLTKTRTTTQSFHIAHENDDGVLDFLRGTARTARITNNGRWVIGGHSEVSSSTLSVQGSFGTTGNAIFGGNITTATNTDYAVLTGIQGGLRVLSSRSSDAGILLTNSSGSFRAQLYGDAAGNYGFLDAHWGNWDIKKVANGEMTIRKSGSYYTVYDTQNLNPITTSNIGSQSVTAAVRLNAFDNRTISPSEFGNNRVRFGFTSWTNNSNGPWADAFHMSSYGDSSGGSANLVMFKKSGIGMRIWQQSFNSSSAYSSYADVMLSTGGTFTDQVTISTAGGNMLVLKDNNSSSTGTTSYVQFVDSSGTQQGYVGHGTSSNGNLFLYANNGRPILGTTSAGFQPQVYYTGNYYTIWHEGNDGSGSGLDADTVDGLHSSSFVKTNATSVINGGAALEFSPDTDNFPKVHMDARVSGSGARLHKWNRDNNNANYLPYYENWWDGNSYQSFGTEGNKWVFNQQIRVSDAYGDSYFGGNQGDEWGRIEFNGHSNGVYIYTNSGDFRVDGGNWNPYSDSDVSLGNSSLRWNGCHIVDWFRVYGGGGVYWNDYGHHIYPNNSTHLYWRSGSSAAVGMLMTTAGTNRGYVYANSSNEMGFLSVGGAWAFQKSVGNTYGTYSVFTGQNSWNGITYSSHSSKPTIMFKDNHGDGGLYHQGSSSWRWYYAQSHTCMGINGSTTSSSYGCYITGSVYTTGSYNSSDARFKTNIETIDNGIDKVMNMRGVYYDWNDEHKEEKGEGRQVGVIAQELNEVLPEAVIHTEEDEYSVDYGKITGVLIEAIKDLKNEINELKKGCCNGS